MPEESFKLMDIVCAFSSATSMLAVDWANPQSTRTDTKYEGILLDNEPDVEAGTEQSHL